MKGVKRKELLLSVGRIFALGQETPGKKAAVSKRNRRTSEPPSESRKRKVEWI